MQLILPFSLPLHMWVKRGRSRPDACHDGGPLWETIGRLRLPRNVARGGIEHHGGILQHRCQIAPAAAHLGTHLVPRCALDPPAAVRVRDVIGRGWWQIWKHKTLKGNLVKRFSLFFRDDSADIRTRWALLTGGKTIFTWQVSMKICWISPTCDVKRLCGVFTRVLWGKWAIYLFDCVFFTQAHVNKSWSLLIGLQKTMTDAQP